MAIEGFSPSPSPSPPPPPYYQLLERGSARLGRVKKFTFLPFYPSRYVRVLSGLLPLGLVYSRRFGVTALLVSHTYMIQSGTKAMD